MAESKGSYALITGASSGIGYELAKLLAADGLNLVITARNENNLKKVKQEIEDRYHVKVKALPKDLSDPKAPAEIFSELEKEGLKVSVLVNNAGFGSYGPFSEADLQKQLEMVQVNIAALTHLTRLFLDKRDKNRPGKILNVASVGAFQPGPLIAVYCASKAYVLHFSEALANELQGSGVSVTCLCPGPTRTLFWENMADCKMIKKRMMDVATVAGAGHEALKEGKVIVIPGLRNRLLALSVRFAPRNTVTRIARSTFEADK